MKQVPFVASITYLLLIIFCIGNLNITFADADEDLTLVLQCLDRYKKGYEQKNYELIASCIYPPMDEVQKSFGSLIKTKKKLVATVIEKWGKQYIEDNKLSELAIDPFSSIHEIKYSNVRLDGKMAYADSEMATSLGPKHGKQVLAKSNGKWYIVGKEGLPNYSKEDRRKMQNGIDLIVNHKKRIEGLEAQVIKGGVKKEEFIRVIVQLETQFQKDWSSLMNR